MRPLKGLVLVKVLVTALLITSCAFVRNIPAESTPLRNARYYRSQDAANMAAGAVADVALGVVLRGPRRCGNPNQFCGTMAPVARVALVGVMGTVRRQTDRGYRESGVLMNVWSAMATEVLRIIWLGARGKLSRWPVP